MKKVTPDQARNLFACYQCKAPSDLFDGDEPFLVSFIKSRWTGEFNQRTENTAAKCLRILVDRVGKDWQIFADLFNSSEEANQYYWDMKHT